MDIFNANKMKWKKNLTVLLVTDHAVSIDPDQTEAVIRNSTPELLSAL